MGYGREGGRGGRSWRRKGDMEEEEKEKDVREECRGRGKERGGKDVRVSKGRRHG